MPLKIGQLSPERFVIFQTIGIFQFQGANKNPTKLHTPQLFQDAARRSAAHKLSLGLHKIQMNQGGV